MSKRETIIDKTPKKGQQGKDTVGEYVDFEEIEQFLVYIQYSKQSDFLSQHNKFYS